MTETEKAQKCPMCGRSVCPEDFKDYPWNFAQEFDVSGMCPTCQVNIFKPPSDEVCGWYSWQGYEGEKPEKPEGYFCEICARERQDLNSVSDCPNLKNGMV